MSSGSIWLFAGVGISGVLLIGVERFWHLRAVSMRLVRLIPDLADKPLATLPGAFITRSLYRFLKHFDPTFSSTMPVLRSFGINSRTGFLIFGVAKLAIAIVSAQLGVLVLTSAGAGSLSAWLTGLMLFLGVIVGIPHILKSLLKDRRRRMVSDLIFALNLITIFLESGQSLGQALRSLADVTERAAPLLAGAQRRLVVDLDNGVPYGRALENWSSALSIDQAKPVAALFEQSLVHGTELAAQLRQFATGIAEARLLMARERIGTKSAQLTVVMVLFFLPALLVFIAGPPVLALFEGIRTVQ